MRKQIIQLFFLITLLIYYIEAKGRFSGGSRSYSYKTTYSYYRPSSYSSTHIYVSPGSYYYYYGGYGYYGYYRTYTTRPATPGESFAIFCCCCCMVCIFICAVAINARNGGSDGFVVHHGEPGEHVIVEETHVVHHHDQPPVSYP